MKKIILTISLVVIALLIFAGCSDDDDCTTCPEMTQRAIMMGWMDLDEGYLGFWGYIVGVTGAIPDVDSVRVDGNLAEMETGYGEGGVGIWVQWEESGYDKSGAEYVSGDTVYVEIFTPYGKCECREKVLDDYYDDPVVLDWAVNYPYDTVAINTAITVEWEPIEHADWYGVELEYDYYTGGVYDERITVFYTTNESFTIAASDVEYDGRYYIRIRPCTGPYPDADNGNIIGGVIEGSIGSSTYESFRIYVGTGQYKVALDGLESDEADQSLGAFLDAYNNQ